jgi:hypothetical protein
MEASSEARRFPGLSMVVTQAFLYNAIFFTSTLGRRIRTAST